MDVSNSISTSTSSFMENGQCPSAREGLAEELIEPLTPSANSTMAREEEEKDDDGDDDDDLVIGEDNSGLGMLMVNFSLGDSLW